jgi:hypothetical protein
MAIDAFMADPDFLKSQEKAFPPVTVTAGESPPLKLVMPSRYDRPSPYVVCRASADLQLRARSPSVCSPLFSQAAAV